MLPTEVHLLNGARGESCQVLAIFLDIRGFSKFAGVAESSDTALFLRDMYARVLTDYFPNFTYAKPTGDGLMIIKELDTEVAEVEQAAQGTLENAKQLIADFPTLTDGNVLITISVPTRLGIGIARGSATRIVADSGEIIDYSGRCLNLAARLMDMARPQGVVLSDRHARDLLGDTLFDSLASDQVYIKGISEDEKVTVLTTPEWVAIPDIAHSPIAYKPTFDQPSDISAARVRSTQNHLIRCHRDPRAGATVTVSAVWHEYDESGVQLVQRRTLRLPGTLREEPEGYYAKVEWSVLHEALNHAKVPDDQPVQFTPYH